MQTILNKLPNLSSRLKYIADRLVVESNHIDQLNFNDVELYNVIQPFVESLIMVQTQPGHSKEEQQFMKEVLKASKNGKIPLIKTIRNHMHTSLKETKDFVEDIYDSVNGVFTQSFITWDGVVIYDKSVNL